MKTTQIQYFGDTATADELEAQGTERTFAVKVGVTVQAGDFVGIDLSDAQRGLGRSVKPIVAGAAAGPGFAGIALETVTGVVGGRNLVRVATPCEQGTYVEGANVADAVTAGSALAVTTVDGRGAVGTVGTHHIVALALTDGDANNRGDVLLLSRG